MKRQIVAVAFVLFFAFGVFSGCRPSTPNDGIGRYQMLVTNSGTLIIMDTVVGTVTTRYKVDESEAPPQAIPRPRAH